MLGRKYVRIQTRYCGKTGKPVGIFGACWHLKRAGNLSNEEVQLFLEIDEWFKVHLPTPPFYEKGNPDKAITWFKRESTDDMLERLQPLMNLLEQYDVEFDVVFTNHIGKIIYEDEYQVAVL